MQIAIDIAKGLVFLHSRRIVHLDLKSPNILLSR
jgi:serine/threonine protein kinase